MSPGEMALCRAPKGMARVIHECAHDGAIEVEQDFDSPEDAFAYVESRPYVAWQQELRIYDDQGERVILPLREAV